MGKTTVPAWAGDTLEVGEVEKTHMNPAVVRLVFKGKYGQPRTVTLNLNGVEILHQALETRLAEWK